jgi:hypothetical protein
MENTVHLPSAISGYSRYAFCMRTIKPTLKAPPSATPRVKDAREASESMTILAANLRLLMQQSPDLNSQPKVSARAKVAQRTVGRALKASHAIQIDKLDAIAAAFGLAAWQLLDPALTIAPGVEEFNRRMRVLLEQQQRAVGHK